MNRALIAAIRRNDSGQVRWLLAHHADPNSREPHFYQQYLDKREGLPPQATSAPPALVIALYLDVHSREPHRTTVQAENTAIIQALAEAGADLNVRYRYNETPLMIADWQGKSEATQILLSHGADFRASNISGTTLFLQAADQGETELMAQLLEKGIDINTKNAYGFNALQEAISSGQVKSVTWLIAHHIDINAKDNGGPTALTLAKRGKLPGVVSLLQQVGAKE